MYQAMFFKQNNLISYFKYRNYKLENEVVEKDNIRKAL